MYVNRSNVWFLINFRNYACVMIYSVVVNTILCCPCFFGNAIFWGEEGVCKNCALKWTGLVVPNLKYLSSSMTEYVFPTSWCLLKNVVSQKITSDYKLIEDFGF